MSTPVKVAVKGFVLQTRSCPTVINEAFNETVTGNHSPSARCELNKAGLFSVMTRYGECALRNDRFGYAAILLAIRNKTNQDLDLLKTTIVV